MFFEGSFYYILDYFAIIGTYFLTYFSTFDDNDGFLSRIGFIDFVGTLGEDGIIAFGG